MNNSAQPKRNIFLSILPYILLLFAVGGLATLIIFNNSVNVEYWTADTLDQQLSAYEVKTAYTSTNYETTLIEGQYRRSDGVLFSYSVRVDNNEYSDSFSVVDLENPDVTKTHQSWQSLFRYEIDAYKIAHPEEATGAKFQVGNAFEVSWWDSWGPTIILLAGTIIVAVFLFSRLSSSVNSTNNKALEFNKSRARREDTSKIRFSDVAGCDEEKAEMVEIVSYLKEPKKFSKFGAKLPKGILLVGPPGTGKTLLAKAVAGEAGVPFYSISGSDFVEMFVGVGAGRVRDMFKRAKQTAPCLIFIDEIDAVGRQRGAGLGGGNDEREQTLNQLLVEMDGFSDNSGIIVIAATNREDVLDPALLRAGRFDRQITVSLPDRQGRAAIFRVHARNKIMDPSVDFDALAKRTVGFSGADIENILNEAAILAVRGNKNFVTIKEIDEAIDRRIAGPAKSSRALNATERKSIAYHEAGHAIIGLSLPHSDRVQKITIIPRGNTGGHVLMTPDEDRFLLTKKELEARIVGYLGGRSSEEIFFNDVSTGAHNDIEMATHIARLMVTEYGMSSLGPIQYEKDSSSVFLGRDYASTQKNFSTQVAYEIDSEVRKIIDDAHKQAIKIIKEHRDQVVLIAETLLEKETITAEDIDSILASVNTAKDDKNDSTKKPVDEPPVIKKDSKKDGE